MAKASKTKKEEVVPEVEQPIEQLQEPVIEEEKVEEVEKQEEPIVEPPKEVIPEVPVKVVETPTPKQEDISMEEKLVKFLQARGSGYFKVNDFIKSLYPITRFNEQPKWLNQGESKRLRNMLETMKSNGQIKIANDMHKRLGTFHYPDTTTLKTEYYNLNTLPLECSL